MRVHIEGEYKCDICSVWFTKNSLECHQRRYHLEFYEERVLNGIRLMKEVIDRTDKLKVTNFYHFSNVVAR